MEENRSVCLARRLVKVNRPDPSYAVPSVAQRHESVERNFCLQNDMMTVTIRQCWHVLKGTVKNRISTEINRGTGSTRCVNCASPDSFGKQKR
ncbi:hypothetical protein CAEBREN_18863 [Caenorhabditis brenneri]|uniref:Uncharacterized protein n=1 Tax=Caenorhabditis brenneri TaxID=135651 RepID=G0NF96_CAEBE|nr:hypothetical protein CAEBREN_18863 [Caenorhabditis brenneri]